MFASGDATRQKQQLFGEAHIAIWTWCSWTGIGLLMQIKWNSQVKISIDVVFPSRH